MVEKRTAVLSGDLDLFVRPAVRRSLDALDGPGIIDMRGVRYVDCSVLAELARTAQRAGAHNVTIVVASRNVRRVLGLVEFERLFVIDDVFPRGW